MGNIINLLQNIYAKYDTEVDRNFLCSTFYLIMLPGLYTRISRAINFLPEKNVCSSLDFNSGPTPSCPVSLPTVDLFRQQIPARLIS